MHPSNGDKKSQHRLPPGWGRRFTSLQPQRGAWEKTNRQGKQYPERRVEDAGFGFVKGMEGTRKKSPPPPFSVGAEVGRQKG